MEKPATSRLVLGAVILVATYFLAQGAVRLANLWILIFGAVIVAVVIRSIADPLVARFKLKDGYAVAVSILALLVLISGAAFLFGRQVAEQFDQLATRLPGAWAMLQARLQASPAASQVVDHAKSLGSEAGKMLAIAPRFAMGALSGVATLFLVIVAGVFLAGQPEQAREGVLSLFPMTRRPRLREVMNTCGRALKGWLKAQLVSMLLVGGLISAGLALIGAPAPLALGLFTGLAQFVPIVGPIVAAVPALLISATGGGKMLLLTLALYVGVSQLESNLITPLVQKNLASLPVVLGIFAVVGLGTLFGPLGILFATPLALVLHVAVTMLYRQDVLHDEAAVAPGEGP
ncbi:AI-2E family transporter [Caulobacter endophyticus]|uniref:AI-2E family transporter n=1 Tax=Caulobacter endophyticus TaxID=2172652 RepID=UPI0018EE6980|nr:AI-2E family transporter [Caulobacter endophyticus]